MRRLTPLVLVEDSEVGIRQFGSSKLPHVPSPSPHPAVADVAAEERARIILEGGCEPVRRRGDAREADEWLTECVGE
eukprot:4878822-Prymnesium_polylepis.1